MPKVTCIMPLYNVGEYLALMDADGMSLRGRFEHQVSFLGTSPDHV